MVCLHLCYHYMVIGVLVPAAYANRIDLENNDGHADISKHENLFKLKVYNDIWARAITKKLPENKLLSLKRILGKLDRTQIDIKHYGEDDNQVKLHIKEHLNEVLKEYGLYDEEVPVLQHQHIHFNDKRINSIWRQAVEEGHFSENELHSLHKEMRHMEEKMGDILALVKETENDRRKADGMENDVRHTENLVEAMNFEDSYVSRSDAVHEMVKDKRTILNEQVMYLQEKVRNKPKEDKSEFTDDRVIRLWDSIKRSNFSGDQIENIKEELRHFQTHIDKLRHWEGYHAKLQLGENKEDLLHTKKKIDEYKRKVKKYHVTMVKQMKEYRVEL